MNLAPGQRLGPYEILSPLGAGGMGEVYRARDVRLDRLVAIKVLPEDLARNRDRLRRFEQEARSASALNHPNIVTVFDVGVEGSISYYATELVEGRTLREMLSAGPLPIKRLLDLAAQIADAIAAAHEAGIVHRDLKPANLMVGRDGLVKLLDFGLAKREARIFEGVGPAATTETSPGTLPGAVLGTVGYMSPEQARGEPIDFRSDQFSFGSILYEMATGVRAFQKGSAIETLHAILNDEPPPIARSRQDFPPMLRWIVERCLAKSPGERYGATRDLSREIQAIREHLSELSGEALADSARGRRRIRARSLAAFGLAVLAAAGAWLLRPRMARPSAVPQFRRLTFRSGLVGRALFVPGSNTILYTAEWDREPATSYLTLPEAKGLDRRLEGPVQLPMAYSEDGSEALVLLGQSRAKVNPIGTLAWWPALGGQPRPILEDAGWADAARKGRFLAVVQVEGGDRVLRIRDSAGQALRTIFRTPGAITWVRISPDEKSVAFIHHPSRFDDSGEVRTVGVDGSGSRAVSGRLETCLGLAWNGKTGEIWYTGTDESIYSTSLWAVRPGGRPRKLYSFPDLLLLQDVADGRCLLIGETGDTKVLLRRGTAGPAELSWLGTAFATDISHDGKSVLFIDGTAEDKTLGTWVRSLDGGEATRVADGEPAFFSPDDQSIVTTTRGGQGPPQVALVRPRTGAVRRLTDSKSDHSFPSFLGAQAVLFSRREQGRSEIWRVGIAGGPEKRVAAGCDRASADPTGAFFLCIGGARDNVLYAGALDSGEPAVLRPLRELEGGSKFLYARWSTSPDILFAVTTDRRLLTLDAHSGGVLRDEPVGLPENLRADAILGAVLNADASVQAYSVSHLSSHLYLLQGL